MSPPAVALVLLAITSATPSDTDIADTFVRALANPDRRPAASLTGSLHGPATHSLRDAIDRFQAIEVRSHAVTASTPESITVVVDATGIVVNASRDRRPLPRVWHLGLDASRRLTSVKSDAHALLDRIDGAAEAGPDTLREAGRLLTDSLFCRARKAWCATAARQLLAVAVERSDAMAATFAAGALARSSSGDPAASAAGEARFWADRSEDPDARASADLTAALVEPDDRRKEVLYANAAACAELLDDPRQALEALWELGYLYLKRFDLRAAHRTSEDLEARSRRLGWMRGEMLGLYGKAQVRASTGDYETAETLVLLSADLAAALEDRERQARALNIQALMRQRRRETWGQAVAILERALSLVPEDAEETLSILHTVLGQTLWSLGERTETERHLETALRTGRASASVYLTATLSFAAGVAEHYGRHREAIAFHRESIQAQGHYNLWHVWWEKLSLAAILIDCGDTDAAIEELLEAVDLTEARRALAKAGDLTRARYFQQHVSIYEALVDALVSRHRQEEALLAAERIRARILADSLNGEAELAVTPAESEELRSLNERLVRLNRKALATKEAAAVRRELREARQALESFEGRLAIRDGRPHSSPPGSRLFDAPLPSSTAAVELMVLPTSVIAFVMRGARVDAVRLPATRQVIAEHAERYATLLARRDASYAEEARALYDLLFAPLRSHLGGVRDLVLVPDGFLWNVPFEALMDSDGAFVGDRFVVEYRPSLSPLPGGGADREPRRPDRELLVLANPESREPDRMADLPEAAREARSIFTLYGAERSDLHCGSKAREALFKETASRYRVIHVATHGLPDRDAPLHSSVLLSSDGGDGEDGVLEAREIARMKLSAQVVVLAACETAGSDAVRGEGLLGLSWSFLAAGSSSVVVSRWSAESTSTSKLMIELHRELVGNRLTAAEALRNARRALRKDARYRHPFYWASFVVIGSGRGR